MRDGVTAYPAAMLCENVEIQEVVTFLCFHIFLSTPLNGSDGEATQS